MTQPIIQVKQIECSHILSLIGSCEGIHPKFNIYGTCENPLFEIKQICHFLKLKESDAIRNLGSYIYIGQLEDSERTKGSRIRLTNEHGVLILSIIPNTEFARAFAKFILAVIKQLFLTGNVNLVDKSIEPVKTKLLSEYTKTNEEYEKELAKKQSHIDTLIRNVEQISSGYTELMENNSHITRTLEDLQDSNNFYECHYKDLKDDYEKLSKQLIVYKELPNNLDHIRYAMKQLPTLYIYKDKTLSSNTKDNHTGDIDEGDDNEDDDNTGDNEDDDTEIKRNIIISYKSIPLLTTYLICKQNVPQVDLTKLSIQHSHNKKKKVSSSYVYASIDEVIDAIWQYAISQQD